MDIEKALKNPFKLKTFRRGQKEILDSVLSGRDALAIMPTGGGKSLCYQLPAVVQSGLVLVISPLISLMEDQVRSLRALGIEAGCLHSSQDVAAKKDTFARMKKAKSFILYLSPERAQKDAFATWLKAQKPLLFAIDEAHCISQWGHDFREDYNKISKLRELCPDVPILALTATATPYVGKDISKRLGLRKPDKHVYGFYRPNLYYQVKCCDQESEKQQYLMQSVEKTPKGRILVYCGTRKSTEAVCELLDSRFSKTSFYHAGLSAEERKKIQNDYDEGRIRILCATNAFGMGIDHPDVRLVVHYQMTASLEAYYQEVGRAGRDGKESTCLLLYSKKDKGLQSYFIINSKAPKSISSYRWKTLDAIVDYSEGGECRHSGILTYFRDTQRISQCGHCDTCDPDSLRGVRETTASKFAPRAIVRKKKRRPAKSKAVADAPITEEVKERMKEIKTWRIGYAKKQDIPAFMVFSNKTLKDLALKKPENHDELLNVYGMGEVKAEQFGDQLLELLN